MSCDNLIIERQAPGCDFALFRPRGEGRYFVIRNPDLPMSDAVMIHFFRDSSYRFFKNRSLAMKVYDGFVSGLNPKRQHEKTFPGQERSKV